MAWAVLCPLRLFLGAGQAGQPGLGALLIRWAALGLLRPWVQGWPGSTWANDLLSLSFLPQLKAFKDEEKAKEALKQQKRKAKVRGLEGGNSP